MMRRGSSACCNGFVLCKVPWVLCYRKSSASSHDFFVKRRSYINSYIKKGDIIKDYKKTKLSQPYLDKEHVPPHYGRESHFGQGPSEGCVCHLEMIQINLTTAGLPCHFCESSLTGTEKVHLYRRSFHTITLTLSYSRYGA